jgi:antitoxin (DNA-binding transcriptional repressor) of toxin-antitoxin stability system
MCTQFIEEAVMKFVSVRDFRSKSGKVWKDLANEKDLLLTSNGKPIALLSSVSEETMDDSLAALRQARAMMAVERIQARARKLGLDRMTPAEIDAEIKAYRRERGK